VKEYGSSETMGLIIKTMVESDILTDPADNNLFSLVSKICVGGFLQGSLPPQMTADLGSQKAWFGFVKGDFYDQDCE
jgi:hypothetical protein